MSLEDCINFNYMKYFSQKKKNYMKYNHNYKYNFLLSHNVCLSLSDSYRHVLNPPPPKKKKIHKHVKCNYHEYLGGIFVHENFTAGFSVVYTVACGVVPSWGLTIC